jgi:predicted DNA-binding transcriptional regulator AlpA
MADACKQARSARTPSRAVAWWSDDVTAWMQACLHGSGRDVAVHFDGPACFLKLREVQRLTGLSRSSLYRKIANGSFPRPILLNGGAA